MVINQQSLQGLNVAYSTAFNKAFEGVQPRYQKVASVVPSTTASTNYNWLGQFPQMREWIGEREIQSLSAYDYVIRNKKYFIQKTPQKKSWRFLYNLFVISNRKAALSRFLPLLT